MQAKALVDTVSDAILELVAKRIEDTLSRVEAKAPVKRKSPTVVPLRAYTVVETLTEMEAKALVYTLAYMDPLLDGISHTLIVRKKELTARCDDRGTN